jgi:hypothetical protein
MQTPRAVVLNPRHHLVRHAIKKKFIVEGEGFLNAPKMKPCNGELKLEGPVMSLWVNERRVF